MMLAQLVALLFVYVCIFALSVATLVLGWGLKPQSWGWIVGCFFMHVILLAIMTGLNSEIKKK